MTTGVMVRKRWGGSVWGSHDARLGWVHKVLLCLNLECFRRSEGAQDRGKKDPKESHKTTMKASRVRGSCTLKVKNVK